MNDSVVTIARVYHLESDDHLERIVEMLRTEMDIQGVTVLRGIAGYGADGELHTSSLLTLSLTLPLIIEFYDTPAKVSQAIHALKAQFALPHIVSWTAHRH